jgi:hypothetical protein
MAVLSYPLLSNAPAAPASATSKPTSLVNPHDDSETGYPDCLRVGTPGDAHNKDPWVPSAYD